MFAFTRIPLARQFLIASFGILLIGMIIIGSWVSAQIEDGVLNRTAALTALYVDSLISPELQALSDDNTLPLDNLDVLDRLLTETKLGEQIVSFKVWSREGTILYSPNRALVGRQFASDDDIDSAFAGKVVTTISNLDKPEHEYERKDWNQLIETYAPIRKTGDPEVIAVSEFYQIPDDLQADVSAAQRESWFVVGISTLIMYLLLAGIVGRASNTILKQQSELENQLRQQRYLFEQNNRLHEKVRRAGARTIMLNELYLRRLSGDLHDGPGQDLALALMRTESLNDSREGDTHLASTDFWLDEWPIISRALVSANEELRKIAAGLRLPELEYLDLSEVAERAVRYFQEKTGQVVDLRNDLEGSEASSPIKIALYRVIQEALFNSYRHSGGALPTVEIWQEDNVLVAEVSDQGRGFNMDSIDLSGRLGLASMRERVELLGGVFSIDSQPEAGTTIRIRLTIDKSTYTIDQP